MKTGRLLRWSRIAVQCIVSVSIIIALVLGMPCIFARMQIVPAILSCSTLWLIVWTIATLIFGRVYCSTACPFGALIDLFSTILRPSRLPYRYTAPSTRLRVSVLVIVVTCGLFGLSAVVALTDPYSVFARIVVACARPAALGVSSMIIALLTLALVIITTRRRGRFICTSLCPVGTVLGTVSRASLYHVDINTDLCVNCRKCVGVCKARCINLNDHVIDPTRCVVCFDCIDVCPVGAITYRRGRHQLSLPMMQRVADPSGVSAMEMNAAGDDAVKPLDRRAFLITGAAVAVAAGQLAARRVAPGYVIGASPLIPLNYVTPPGATSREDFLRRCTACSSCIAACPTAVLKSSSNQYGIRHALKPVMDFSKSYCSFNCAKCTTVCPTGALTAITLTEKRSTRIGIARIAASNCRLYVNGTRCGVCAKVCPRRAITIIRDNNGRRVPRVEPELCIGCGRCANACPSQPYRAIVIEGL